MNDYNKCIEPAYKKEIDALFKGPLFLIANNEEKRTEKITSMLEREYEHKYSYNEKIIKFTASKSPVFLIIDNVDQFEDINTQSDIFSTSIALAHRTGVNLIFSLREATYVLHKNTPTFDAFDFDPITIDSPDISSVLSKRFFVANQLLKGKTGEFTAENGARLHLSDLSIIIDLLQSSVLGSEIGNIIEVLSSGDIRLALRMTREFLQSGYSSTGKALEIFQTTGRYLLPPHEALRAIMVGNQSVYHEAYSVIGNPLDSNLKRTELQFLRLYILSALVHMGSDKSFQGITGEEIRKIIRSLGFGDDVTIDVLKDLCNLRFLYTLSHSNAEFSSTYVSSRLGGYIIKHLLCDFTFLENIMVDTFIADTKIWNEIYQMTDKIYSERNKLNKFKLRKKRLEVFFSYMKNSFEALRIDSLKKGISSSWCSNPLHDVENRFTENARKALRSAIRNYGGEAL